MGENIEKKKEKKINENIPGQTLCNETQNQMRQQHFGRLDNDLYWLYPIHNSLDKRSGVNLAVCCLHAHRMNEEEVKKNKFFESEKNKNKQKTQVSEDIEKNERARMRVCICNLILHAYLLNRLWRQSREN